jgi:hypothetical protein
MSTPWPLSAACTASWRYIIVVIPVPITTICPVLLCITVHTVLRNGREHKLASLCSMTTWKWQQLCTIQPGRNAIDAVYHGIYKKNRYIPWYISYKLVYTIVYTMVYIMVYTTCRESEPIVALWYIPWYIPVFWYIPWYCIYSSQGVIYHGIYKFDPFLPHGIYQFEWYIAWYDRYVSFFLVHSMA